MSAASKGATGRVESWKALAQDAAAELERIAGLLRAEKAERAGLLAERDALAARVAELERDLEDAQAVIRDSGEAFKRGHQTRALAILRDAAERDAARAALAGGTKEGGA